MSGWCGLTNICDYYKRDQEAVDELERKYGKDNLVYKIVYKKLEQDCNHNHLKCGKLKELLNIKL